MFYFISLIFDLTGWCLLETIELKQTSTLELFFKFSNIACTSYQWQTSTVND